MSGNENYPEENNDQAIRPKKPFKKKLLKPIIIIFLVTFAAVAGGTAYVVAKYSSELPDLSIMHNYKPSLITTIYDRHDQKIAEFYVEKRILRKLDEIPSIVKLSTLAIEDNNFYSHRGIDLWGVARAALVNIRSGEVVQGGSTITQQVAKILFLTRERTFDRKIKEGLLSLRIERSFSKDEILEIYLNQIYYGHGAYGVEAASQLYFGKHVEEISLAEAALLAGLPKAPSNFSPFLNREGALKRKALVISRMKSLGYIDPLQADQANAEELMLVPRKKPLNYAPFFAEHVRRYLGKHYGSTSLYREGLKVYTTLDLDLQKSAQNAVRGGLVITDRRLGYRGPEAWINLEEEVDWESLNPGMNEIPEQERFIAGTIAKGVVRDVIPEVIAVDINGRQAIIEESGFSWAHPVDPKEDGRIFKPVEDAATLVKPGDVITVRIVDNQPGAALLAELHQIPVVQGALLAMDYHTGAIRSMIGGYDFKTSEFNRTVQAYRQAGSAFKPIIYAAALDRGFTPASIIVDAPLIFEDEIGEFKNWKPVNFRQKFYGPTTVRAAVTHSRNIVTIKVLQKIGIKYVIEYAGKIGIKSALDDNLSLALGASSVNLMELTSVYGVFANKGERNEPYFIRRIEDRNGTAIEQHEEKPEQVIPEDTAFLLSNILHAVVKEGTGRKVNHLGVPTAGKTGTTNDFMDAWFIGYASNIVTGVWVGMDREVMMGKNETGSRAAAPIWLQYMKEAVNSGPKMAITPPKNIIYVKIDRKSGKLATPGNSDTVFETFREGSQPTEYAEPVTPPETITPVEAVTPPDLVTPVEAPEQEEAASNDAALPSSESEGADTAASENSAPGAADTPAADTITETEL